MHYSNDKYITVGEHNFLLPEFPKSKKDIFFYNRKKEDQFWDRSFLVKDYRQIWFDFIPKSTRSEIYTRMFQSATLYDQDGLLISLNEEDSLYIDRVYKQEVNRRVNGVWFFNNGELTYITGSHYFFLMYARMQRHDGEGLWADYREFQSHYFFYLLDHAINNQNTLGAFWSKPKKTGITNALWAGYYLNKATLYRNKNLGYMNIDKDQAAKTFVDYFLYAYNGLISPIKPEYKTLSPVEGRIHLGKSYGGSRKKPKPNSEDEDDINTTVTCVATKNKAFDVAVMSDITCDEPTKYKEPFEEIWRTNKEAVKIQSKINGKAWLFNYTEGKDTDSFRQAREIFWDSKLKTITEHSKGQTKSGLICAHIPAYAAWEGAFDKYGICNEKKAFYENSVERAKVANNKRALQAVIRQYANDEKEAWGSAGAGSVFDNIRLSQLATALENEIHESPVNLYQAGKLEWINPKFEIRGKRPKGAFSAVKFVPLTEGELMENKEEKMRFFVLPKSGRENISIKNGRDEDNCLLPPKRFDYLGGFDPTNYAAGSEVIEGSKNGGYIMNMPDVLSQSFDGEITNGILCCEYFHRPELPDEAFEDFIKMVIFYGVAVVVEGNASYVATRMLEEGLGHYMFVKDDNGNLVLWERWMGLAHEEDKKYQLIRITANSAFTRDMLEMIVRLIKQYIEEPPKGERDFGKTIKSERLLRQLMDFNPEDTRRYDLVMAFGWCLVAKYLYTESLLAPQYEVPPSEISSVMRALIPA